MNQRQTFLSACIELRELHLLEWKALAVNRQTAWQLIHEETAEKLSLCIDDERSCLLIKSQQAMRLIKIMARQREERAQMKERHREDFFLLKYRVETPE